MNRKIVLVVLLAGVGCWLALQSSRQPRAKRAGDLNKTEIEAEVREGLKLKEVHLAEMTKGEFSGTGSASDGTKYKIKVTQGESKITWESEDDKGGKVIGSKGWNSGQLR
jgi:hypothetical protein